ncbi:hypothetical protein SAMN02745196_02690, partial [Clostridium collagenovorans DSM 3089]
MGIKKKRKVNIITFIVSITLFIGIFSETAMAQNIGVLHTTLLSNVPLYCEAKLAALPDSKYEGKEILAITIDNSDSSKCDLSEVYYSIYDGRSFAVPMAIEQDGTWDMEPFLYSNEEVLIAWTDATMKLVESPIGYDIASAMRISLSIYDPITLTMKPPISNISYYGSDNISTYNPRITKVGDEILVSWVVCNNILNDTNAYGIEGMYYNPETNTFYSENNTEVTNGNLVPMIFAKECSYISNYSISEIKGEVVTMFEESVDQTTHISDVMFDKVIKKIYPFFSEKYKDSIIKISTNKGNTVTDLTDGDSYSSIIESDNSMLLYYNKNKIYSINNVLSSVESGGVSETGDARYTIVSQNGVPTYLTAMKYEPFTTSEYQSEIIIDGKTYVKIDDEKWMDESGDIRTINKEHIYFYYVNFEESKLDLLSQKLYKENQMVFPCPPSFIINESNELVCTYTMNVIESGCNSSSNLLRYSKCDEEYLMSANYSVVDEAIRKAYSINMNNYINFSAVIDAINAVVRDKHYTEQDIVNGYAIAIENAINTQLKPADYSKVDAVIEKANDLRKEDYKDFSAVTAAINGVIRGKDI